MSRDRAIALLQKLISFNTTNPPGQEEPLARYVGEYLNKNGFMVEYVPVCSGRVNVVGRLTGLGNREAMLLAAHLDTVGTGVNPWRYDPFSGVLSDGKIYGRGAADMKSGLAAMLLALESFVKDGQPPAGDIIFIGTVGEETDSSGALELVRRGIMEAVGAVVIGEPTGNRLCLGHKGALWVQLTTFGKSAHSSMPTTGDNAINYMLELIGALTAKPLMEGQHPVLGVHTCSMTTIRGGFQVNVIPDQCELTLDIRTLPGQDHRELIQTVKEVINRQGIKVDIKILNDRCSIWSDPGHPFLQVARKCARELFNREVDFSGVNYYTDASVLAPSGNVPVLIFGPGNPEQAHQPDEYVEIDKYLDSIEFYKELIKNWVTYPLGGL
ncbi:M20 family metallopeptidase [Desulforamulus putei]|uniref:Succinyl-diaminopimelate desuccinylase n=1 Tax=Desulforamulus putei DSM 12395 TaxID=1121429 RepID=A0A1M5CHS5_9FIRM|nr:M20 family metallopeptidase [Desulforamulus putei]SHF53962.1 succinyl-diaminopimelate desuccinylase [Desulforamulus putei DSM 12395]